MPKRFLLGIDVGTSGCKVTLFDFQGSIIASHTDTYKTIYSDKGYVEQNPQDWWRAICNCTTALLKDNIDPKEIAAIGVDGTSWACIPVDKQGNVLRPAMLWLDRRADRQAIWMKDRIGEEKLIELSGNPVDPAYITPKMLWMKEHEPDIYIKTDKFLQSNGFVVYRLTEEYSQDYSQGYGLHFFDITKGRWDEDIANALDISLDLLAPLCDCHKIVGTVTTKAARETGLAPGIPVVAGGLDAACCTLGAGVVRSGQTQEQGGQAGGMSIQLDRPLIHPKLILGYHVIPDQWLLQGGTVGGSGSLRWFNEQLGAAEQQLAKTKGTNPYDIMSQEASSIGVGSDGLIFLPYMAGERSPIWDSQARGVFFGLSYNKTRAHMIRSIMEGVGFSLLHNLETAAEVGAVAKDLNSVGGAANSKVWTQIKADITGRTIHVPFSDHATTLGAAILAGVGAGIYKDFDEAVDKTVQITRTHYPNQQNHRLYRQYYEIYLELYKNLKDSYRKLDKISL